MKHSFSWEVRTWSLSVIISEAVTHSLNLFTKSPMLVSLFYSYLPHLPFLPGSIISYFPLVLCCLVSSRLVLSCLVFSCQVRRRSFLEFKESSCLRIRLLRMKRSQRYGRVFPSRLRVLISVSLPTYEDCRSH